MWVQKSALRTKQEVSLFVNRSIAYNQKTNVDKGYVRGGVVKQEGFESAFLEDLL